MSGCITWECCFWNAADECCELDDFEEEEFFRSCPCALGNEAHDEGDDE